MGWQSLNRCYHRETALIALSRAVNDLQLCLCKKWALRDPQTGRELLLAELLLGRNITKE